MLSGRSIPGFAGEQSGGLREMEKGICTSMVMTISINAVGSWFARLQLPSCWPVMPQIVVREDDYA